MTDISEETGRSWNNAITDRQIDRTVLKFGEDT